jgi:2,4-dienoyl-CoA reductase-like NADH-dependent reductase (Old Yellow Enzyme family)
MNNRTDEFGQDSTKFGCEIIKAAKEKMPENIPLLMRLSGKEYVEGGYDIHVRIRFSKKYPKVGIEIFDVSFGGEGQLSA